MSAAEGAEPPHSRRKASLAPIFLTVFVDVLALTFVLPLLPYYAQSLGATPLAVGFLFASFSFCQFLSGPVLGRLSDRVGRKPVLVGSQMGTFVGLLILAAANRVEWLFVGRIIDGLTAGNLGTAQAYITDETKPEERTRAYGFFGIAFGVGFLVGPAFSGILAKRYGFDKPALAAAGLSLLSITLSSTLLPKRPRPKPPAHGLSFRAGVAEILRDRGPRGRILELFAFVLSFATLTGGLALFLQRRLGFDVDEAGYTFALSGLVGALAQGGIGRLAKRLGEGKLSLAGLVVMIVGYAILASAQTIVVMGIAICIGGLGSAVVRPALTTLLTGSVTDEKRGLALGVSQSASSLGQALGPALAGFIIHQGALSLWAISAASFAACAIAVRFLSPQPEQPSTAADTAARS